VSEISLHHIIEDGFHRPNHLSHILWMRSPSDASQAGTYSVKDACAADAGFNIVISTVDAMLQRLHEWDQAVPARNVNVSIKVLRSDDARHCCTSNPVQRMFKVGR